MEPHPASSLACPDHRQSPGNRKMRPIDVLLSPRLFGLPLLATIVLVTPLLLRTGYQFDLVITIGINAIVAIGLNLLMGYAGQISLAHAGFFGMGAYISAILPNVYGWNGLLALLAATGTAALVAFVIARPILRLSGHYLAMATLGVGMIIYIVVTTERRWTGGPDGMAVPPLELFGFTVSGAQTWYWIVGGLLVLTFWLATNLIDSPLGRALRAIKGSEIAAQASGVDVAGLKTLIFVFSVSIAAFMGGIFAFYSGFITPNLASFIHSVLFATMVVLGGMASTVGAIIGAAILTMLPQYLTTFAQYEWLIYGIVLMVIVIFMPKGIVPTLADLIKRSVR